jgi:hypothetical protein
VTPEPILAQAVDAGIRVAEQAGSTLANNGTTGVVILCLFVLLFGRDFYLEKRRDAREEAREKARNEEINRLVQAVADHDEARNQKIDQMLEATHNLVQSNLLETLSRPHLFERARADAEALQRKISGAT